MYQTKEENKQALEDFRKAVKAAVISSSRVALDACSKQMVIEATKQAKFNNYSGTLIRAYHSAVITSRKLEIEPKSVPSTRISKGGGTTAIYNKSANIIRKAKTLMDTKNNRYSSADLPIKYLGSYFHKARPLNTGKGEANFLFVKKLSYIRSHTEPREIISQYDTNDEYGERKVYPTVDNIMDKLYGYAGDGDHVILTNTAPYAETVHRKWNRVLPGNLPAYMKRFYISYMEKTVNSMR